MSSDKSYVSLSNKICIVCGKAFHDGELLIHKQLRPTLERETITGYGFCQEHQAMIDEGKVFLAEVSNPPTEATKMSLLSAQKTGRVISLPREVLQQVLTPGFVTDDSSPYVLAESELIEELISLFNQSPTENDTVH